MNHAITVAIPTHKARTKSGLLNNALDSVYAQTRAASAISVAQDVFEEGAARTRQRALDMVSTPWTAFLDSDDEFLPFHLEKLMQCAQDTKADYVFSYFVRARGGDPLGHFGKPFDPANPHHTTITVLVRTELAKDVGFVNHPDHNPQWAGEDWLWLLGCVERGAKVVHHPEETWVWNRHGGNTSGVWGRGDAQ